MKQVILLVGIPGSTKSTYAKQHYNSYGCSILSRDVNGGSLVDLIPNFVKLLKKPNIHTIILDNTHLTKSQRALFIGPASKLGIPVTVIIFQTPITNCEIRILRRNSPLLPPFVLKKLNDNFETPTLDEGIKHIITLKVPPPSWDPNTYTNKALFLDVDGTLRETSHLKYKYPTKESEVKLIAPKLNMCRILKKYRDQGYILIAVSNQSGIARQVVDSNAVEKCFKKILTLLNNCVNIHFLYCPHFASSWGCWCRKPHTGLVIQATTQFNINPLKSIMVGDRRTDEELANSVGARFIKAFDFWKCN